MPKGGFRSPITKETRAKVLELASQGTKYAEIEKATGVAYQTISRICCQAGLRRQRKRGQRRRTAVLTTATRTPRKTKPVGLMTVVTGIVAMAGLTDSQRARMITAFLTDKNA